MLSNRPRAARQRSGSLVRLKQGARAGIGLGTAALTTALGAGLGAAIGGGQGAGTLLVPPWAVSQDTWSAPQAVSLASRCADPALFKDLPPPRGSKIPENGVELRKVG
jgi:hypothetical protein